MHAPRSCNPLQRDPLQTLAKPDTIKLLAVGQLCLQLFVLINLIQAVGWAFNKASY